MLQDWRCSLSVDSMGGRVMICGNGLEIRHTILLLFDFPILFMHD